MPEPSIDEVAAGADIIVDGYAFTREPGAGGAVRVLNLRRPTSSAVLDSSGAMLETTMDDVELSIVEGIYRRDSRYLGAADA